MILVPTNSYNFWDFAMQVISECNKAEQWLREKAQLQESVPKNVDPILLSSEIKEKSDTLDAYVSYHTNLDK